MKQLHVGELIRNYLYKNKIPQYLAAEYAGLSREGFHMMMKRESVSSSTIEKLSIGLKENLFVEIANEYNALHPHAQEHNDIAKAWAALPSDTLIIDDISENLYKKLLKKIEKLDKKIESLKNKK